MVANIVKKFIDNESRILENFILVCESLQEVKKSKTNCRAVHLLEFHRVIQMSDKC